MSAFDELLRAHMADARAAVEDANRRADALEQLVERLLKRLDEHPPAVAQPDSKVRRLNGWSAEEEAVLRENYPLFGAPGCARLLPHRTQMAIRVYASRHLGLRRLQGRGCSTKLWCGQCDRRVTETEAEICESPFCTAQAEVA